MGISEHHSEAANPLILDLTVKYAWNKEWRNIVTVVWGLDSFTNYLPHYIFGRIQDYRIGHCQVSQSDHPGYVYADTMYIWLFRSSGEGLEGPVALIAVATALLESGAFLEIISSGESPYWPNISSVRSNHTIR